MTQITKKCSIIIILLCVRIVIFAQPSGIYALDSNQGTYRDANIRNYSFVDGFVWRTNWSDMETSQGVYNFAGLDHIVQKLDSINKKLTILFGAYSVEPAYISSQAGVTTYSFTDPISNKISTRAVPYDGFLIQRFRVFVSSLANHPIYCRSLGTIVALKNHPVLANIGTNIPGLGAIRNVNGTNTSLQTSLTNYTRTKFIDSLLVSMKIQTDNFPTKNVFIPSYKNVNDNIASPALADYVKQQLLSTFDGVQNQKISFWQENLAGFTDTNTNTFTGLPTTAFATPLTQLGNGAYTMFQMLQGWTTPFLDPLKTANSTPFDAMCYAYKSYGASYFEIYVSDLDNAIYQQGFKNWNAANCNALSALQDSENQIQLKIYPNPASHFISIQGISEPNKAKVSVLDLYGQHLLSIQNPSNADVSSLSNGIYLIQVELGTEIHILKLIIQH
jgi:Secretion system C-terminal sorting domain